jgi:hypothetical protein
MKKMFDKYSFIAISLVASSIMLAACGNSSSSTSRYASDATAPMAYESKAYSEEAMMEGAAYDGDLALYDTNSGSGASAVTTTENAATSNRKLIRNASLSVETKEFDTLIAGLSDKIKGLGGYIEDMSGNYGSKYSDYRYSKSAHITARIPADKLDEFINSVGEQANITSKSESVRDITLDYVDMESHKKMLKEEQDRLLKFLDEAETIEDIITIEDRLTNVKYQLESMESQLRTYDNKIDYSTVNIDVEEVIDYTIVTENEKTPVERMTEGFKESVHNIAVGLREFGIWFVVKLPYIILIAVIGVIAALIARAISKRNAKKREELRLARMTKAADVPDGANDNAGLYVNRPGSKDNDTAK